MWGCLPEDYGLNKKDNRLISSTAPNLHPPPPHHNNTFYLKAPNNSLKITEQEIQNSKRKTMKQWKPGINKITIIDTTEEQRTADKKRNQGLAKTQSKLDLKSIEIQLNDFRHEEKSANIKLKLRHENCFSLCNWQEYFKLVKVTDFKYIGCT